MYPTRQSARDHGVELVQSVDGDVGAQMVGRSVGRSLGVIGTLFHTLLRAHEFVYLFVCLHLQFKS